MPRDKYLLSKSQIAALTMAKNHRVYYTGTKTTRLHAGAMPTATHKSLVLMGYCKTIQEIPLKGQITPQGKDLITWIDWLRRNYCAQRTNR